MCVFFFKNNISPINLSYLYSKKCIKYKLKKLTHVLEFISNKNNSINLTIEFTMSYIEYMNLNEIFILYEILFNIILKTILLK